MAVSSVAAPHQSQSPTARVFSVEAHAQVGMLAEAIALTQFALSAVGAAFCPHTAGPVSEARNALSKLEALLKDEAGYWDRLAQGETQHDSAA